MSASTVPRDPATVVGPPEPTRHGRRGSSTTGTGAGHGRRLGLRIIALGYLAALLLLPLLMVFYRTFEHGLGPVWSAVTAPDAEHAFWLSIELVAIVVPLNTVFGVGMALLLERGRFRGRGLLGLLVDLPFAISPVVVGLALVLVYGNTTGWFGGWLTDHGIQVIFSVPGMVLATAFVSLPFVARETIPVLRELGVDAELAAATLGADAWQTFRRITLPAIRWGVVYGVVLTTARALGEFGAVSIVSGRLEGQTQTLPLYVQDRFENFDTTGAYAAAVVLALLALATLLAMNLLTRRTRARSAAGQAQSSDRGTLSLAEVS
jgi:sulfate/thiosulfate transport system permease protein